MSGQSSATTLATYIVPHYCLKIISIKRYCKELVTDVKNDVNRATSVICVLFRGQGGSRGQGGF